MKSSEEYYNSIAADYRKISRGRMDFLEAVDDYVIEYAGKRSRYLDVGAGDGVRSLKIANAIEAEEIVLLDNSPQITAGIRKDPRTEIVIDSITNFTAKDPFDLVTCLWNVLGHVGDREDRREALQTISRLLHPEGLFVLDLNNRYNIAHYGYKEVMKNLTTDIHQSPQSGWFTTGSGEHFTKVYVHAPLEIDPLLEEAGLVISDTYFVDYRTGEKRETFFEGQLLYFIKKRP